MKDVIVIGIAGGTGSGKSTLIQKIKEEFSDEITMLSHDFIISSIATFRLRNEKS